MKEDRNPSQTPASSQQVKGTNNQRGINSHSEKRYCLWINQDTGEINVIPTSTPIEKVPFGFYVPHHMGSMSQMEKKKRQIILSRIKPPKLH